MADQPKCLFAYTDAEPAPAGIYVGFFNMSQLPDGSIRVIIRERGDSAAPHASLVIPASQVSAVFR
jgi:hypothetical protein